MDPRKFDYLETIREKIEAGDTDDLQEYIESIKDYVKNDPHFTELIDEINNKKFEDALSLVDEVIFEDMQSEFEEFYQEGELASSTSGRDSEDPDFDPGFGEEESDDVTFEEFDEEKYYGGNNPEDDY